MKYAIISIGLFLAGCSRHPDIPVGTLFSIQISASEYRVAKTLVVRGDGIHLLLYANTWPVRPFEVRPSEFRTSTFNATDFLSRGYLPLTWKAFDSLAAVEVGKTEIAHGDLYPYGTWDEALLPYFDGSISEGFVERKRE